MLNKFSTLYLLALSENNRNNLLETNYGNRNPFIDNPYLAKIIWGGGDEPEAGGESARRGDRLGRAAGGR